MSIYDVLAWGFVGFTGLVSIGLVWLWWEERNIER